MELTVLTKKPTHVTTVRNKKVSRDSAKLVQGKYYERDIDIFHIKNTQGKPQWYRVESGKISLNYETGKWDLISRLEKDTSLIRGIVDDSKQIVFFRKDLYRNVLVLERLSDSPFESLACINREQAEKLGYIECLYNDFFYKKSNLNYKEIEQIKQKKKVNYVDRGLDYNANQGNKTYLQTLKAYEANKGTIEIENSVKEMESFIDRYSFGVEFESSTGTMPTRLLDALGILPVKDGSIAGYEYTTVPLQGTLGLQTLKLACQELSKRCLVDHKCSLHVHIGNVKKEKAFILAFWMLVYKIQGELIDLFPEYKKDQVKYLGSKKNYCEPLPNLGFGTNTLFTKKKEGLRKADDYEEKLEEAFEKIYQFLSGGYPSDKTYNFNTFRHPQDENGKQKWNRTARYRVVNFIPTVFDKSKTVEFRLHTPTFNHTKVSNWLFICLAMVRFVEIHQDEIIARKKDFDLKTIVDGYKTNFGNAEKCEKGTKIAKYLKAYMGNRKDTFKKAMDKGDYLCEFELKKDAEFSFEFEDIKTLY